MCRLILIQLFLATSITHDRHACLKAVDWKLLREFTQAVVCEQLPLPERRLK